MQKVVYKIYLFKARTEETKGDESRKGFRCLGSSRIFKAFFVQNTVPGERILSSSSFVSKEDTFHRDDPAGELLFKEGGQGGAIFLDFFLTRFFFRHLAALLFKEG